MKQNRSLIVIIAFKCFVISILALYTVHCLNAGEKCVAIMVLLNFSEVAA